MGQWAGTPVSPSPVPVVTSVALLFMGHARDAMAIDRPSLKLWSRRQVAAGLVAPRKDPAHAAVNPCALGEPGAGAAPAASAWPERAARFLRVAMLLGAWYVCNLIYSVSNKAALQLWRFPFVFGTIQLGVGFLYVLLLWAPLPRYVPSKGAWALAPMRAAPVLARGDFARMLPAALLLAVGHTAATAAPAYGSVAFTNVVKTTETLFASVCLAVVSKKVFSPAVYVTLVPVVVGVALATVNELDFSWFTLGACGVSMNAFALYSIAAKDLLGALPFRQLGARNMYAVLCFMSFVLLLPVSLALEGPGILRWWREQGPDASGAGVVQASASLAPLVLTTGLFNYLSNELAFCVLDMCSPLTYAVANTLKRVIVIVGSVLIFKTRVTPVGVFGATLAVAGAFLYSLSLDIVDARRRQGKAKGA